MQKLQEAAEQAKTTEQKREEQSAAGNVLSKVGFHFMMIVDRSKDTDKASNLAHCKSLLSDFGGEEAQSSSLQFELRPTAQRPPCTHISGRGDSS